MRKLIDNRDLRSLFGGAAVAVASGLILGGVMQPNLRADDRPEGPQILAGIAAPRADHLYDVGASWAAYRGRVPDHVIGTDWLKPREYAVLAYDERSEPAPEADTVVFTAEEAPAEPMEMAQRWEEPPREPVSYPSMSGGAYTGADLPQAPEPPPEGAYAPAEVTG